MALGAPTVSDETHPARLLGGTDRDSNDHDRVHHGRHRYLDFPVGRYGPPSPMLFMRDGRDTFLGEMYCGSAAFLICYGLSLPPHDLIRLEDHCLLTFSAGRLA